MKTKLILLLLIIIISFNSKAQNNKTFKGNVKGGTLTYEYYTNSDGEIIKNGKIKYSRNENGYTCNISGNFITGKREGNWKFDITYNNVVNDNLAYKGYKKLSLNYKKGRLDGICNYNSTMQVKKQEYINGIMQWGKYDKKTNVNIQLNFKEGNVIGNFKIQDGFDNRTAIGQFDNNLLANGMFRTQDDLTHTITTAKYIKGIPVEFNKTNTRTGKSEYDLKKYPLLYNYHNQLAKGLISEKDLKSTDDFYYKIEKVHSIAPIEDVVKKYIYQDEFLFYEINGDLNYDEGEVIFQGNIAFIVEKYGYMSIRSDNDFRSAKSMANSKYYIDAINELQKLIKRKRFSKSDTRMVKKLIEEYKVQSEKEYASEIKKGDEFLEKEDYDSANTHYQIAKKCKPSEVYPLNQQKLIERIKKAIKVSNNKIININNKIETIDKLYENGNKKRRIYNAFIVVYNNYNKLSKKEKSIFNKIKISDKQSKFLDRIIYLAKVKTKKIEKALKKEDNLKEIEKIIFSN